MPKVGKMKFPYSKKGMEDATNYAKQSGRPMQVEGNYMGGGKVLPKYYGGGRVGTRPMGRPMGRPMARPGMAGRPMNPMGRPSIGGGMRRRPGMGRPGMGRPMARPIMKKGGKVK